MELIIEPQILFLDEPTTGLDASTAVSVVQLLKKYDLLHSVHLNYMYSLNNEAHPTEHVPTSTN